MTTMTIIPLPQSHLNEAAETLAQAFLEDPISRYFYREVEQSCLPHVRWLSNIVLRYSEPYQQIYTTPDLEGVAVWLPPGQFPLNDLYLLRLGLYQFPWRVRWQRVLPFLSGFVQLENYHKQDMSQPHWYLFMLGVLPQAQGQGIGSQLLQPVLEQADQKQLPCYLETDTERAVRFYQRHGFEILRSGKLNKTGPAYWTMKRQPKR